MKCKELVAREFHNLLPLLTLLVPWPPAAQVEYDEIWLKARPKTIESQLPCSAISWTAGDAPSNNRKAESASEARLV